MLTKLKDIRDKAFAFAIVNKVWFVVLGIVFFFGFIWGGYVV